MAVMGKSLDSVKVKLDKFEKFLKKTPAKKPQEKKIKNWIIDENGIASPSEHIKWHQATLLPFEEKDLYTFKNFRVNESNEKAYQALIKWTSEIGNGFFIYGPNGVGKTHLLKAFIEKNANYKKPIWFKEARKIIQEIGKSENQREAMRETILKRLIEPYGLVLDEIQEIKEGSDFQNFFIKDLLDMRKQNGKFTFLSCDLTPEQIKNHFHKRVIDRIGGHCEPIRIDGLSQRKLQRQERSDKWGWLND
jgi:DNA replication protein DnaC